jgi:hypothetical protein
MRVCVYDLCKYNKEIHIRNIHKVIIQTSYHNGWSNDNEWYKGMDIKIW